MTCTTNTGNRNTGDYNTGNRNTGNYNTGKRNTGNHNTGHLNTGHRNTGSFNAGYYNTGERNTGHRNTGHHNTGYYNTGDRNTGDFNTGDFNTGHQNTGNWNVGSFHAGCFNTKTAEMAYYFNKLIPVSDWGAAHKPNWLCKPSPTTWVDASHMTAAEKAENPSHKTTGGYLRTNDMREEWRKAYESASEDNIQAVRNLPGFDANIFEQITGLKL